jgi:hypothetical protein
MGRPRSPELRRSYIKASTWHDQQCASWVLDLLDFPARSDYPIALSKEAFVSPPRVRSPAMRQLDFAYRALCVAITSIAPNGVAYLSF